MYSILPKGVLDAMRQTENGLSDVIEAVQSEDGTLFIPGFHDAFGKVNEMRYEAERIAEYVAKVEGLYVMPTWRKLFKMIS